MLADLRQGYEKADSRTAFEREEQNRIKAQIREEQLHKPEIPREFKQLEREQEAIQVAVQKLLRRPPTNIARRSSDSRLGSQKR